MSEKTTESFLEAVLAVQSEAPVIHKDKEATVRSEKGNYTYRYATLEAVLDAVGPLLEQHGLVWMTKPGISDTGHPTLDYTLAHVSSGEREEGSMPLMLSKQDAQGMGSAITYARRYALCAVLNLVADEDDDGAGVKAEGEGQAGRANTGSSAPAPAPSGNGDRDTRPISSGAKSQNSRLYAIAMQRFNSDQPRALEAIGRACLAVANVDDSRQLPRWAYEDVVAIVEGSKPMPTGPPDVPIDTEGLPEPGQQTTVDDNEPVPF